MANHKSVFLLLSIGMYLTTGCNNDNNAKDDKAADTTSYSKASARNAPSFDTSRSVTTISPNLYKPLADTLNIRMIEGIYKPGDSSIMHAHPDFALYVLEGSTVELTSTNGSKQNMEFQKNMAVILPADSHSAKNIGKTTLKLIVVEVNRPRD